MIKRRETIGKISSVASEWQASLLSRDLRAGKLVSGSLANDNRNHKAH